MSKFKIVASVAGLAFIAAFITKPVDVCGEVAKEPAPVAAKANRSAITVNSWACADEPGPTAANGGPRRNGSSSAPRGRSDQALIAGLDTASRIDPTCGG